MQQIAQNTFTSDIKSFKLNFDSNLFSADTLIKSFNLSQKIQYNLQNIPYFLEKASFDSTELKIIKINKNFHLFIMTQKNFDLQLNLTRITNTPPPFKNVHASMINPKFSDTNRSQKFIPMQFRERYQHHEDQRGTDRYRQHKSNFSFILPSTKRSDLPLKSKQQRNIMQADRRSTDQKRSFFKNTKKTITLKDINVDIPKLRQTNSTKCQSPKAQSLVQENKVNQFKKIRLLGKGKFGDVYLTKHKKTGFIAAMKIIRKSDLLSGDASDNSKAIEQLIRQIKLQAYMEHPNLIQLYDFFSDEENVYLLLQLACDGHLFQFLQTNKSFSEETTSIIARQIIEGIDYMHKRDIIHRDIKLQNIVMSHGMAKICDFGWSVYCPREFRTTLCGTPLYLSPQILIGKQYNKKIDTWAVGALTHQLYTGQNPFKIKNKDDLSKIVTEDFEMEEGSPELRSFITFILRKNPVKRPDSDTIKRHPFIQRYRDLETSQQLCQLASKKKKYAKP